MSAQTRALKHTRFTTRTELERSKEAKESESEGHTGTRIGDDGQDMDGRNKFRF